MTVQDILDYCKENDLSPKDTKVTIYNDYSNCFVSVRSITYTNDDFYLTKKAFKKHGKAICLDYLDCRCDITLDY